MEKLLFGISGDISDKLFSHNGNITFPTINAQRNKNKQVRTLLSCIQYLSKINDIENDLTGINFGFQGVILNDELSNHKVRQIAWELAQAIDNNSIQTIKELKKQYGNEKEYITAKKFLDVKCKEVWDVYSNDYKNFKIPYEAMKTLGISNRPTLEFLLGNSIKYYEQEKGLATVNTIRSILKNTNLGYNLSDIHEFLKTYHKKEHCNYNIQTIAYLINEQNYNETMLQELGILEKSIKEALKNISPKSKIKYYIRNIKFSFRLL